MKVIKAGPEHTHRTMCEHCKSMLELVPSDVFDDNSWGTSSNCGQCGKRFRLYSEHMSSSFKKQVKWDE